MNALDKWEQSHNLDEFTDFQIVEMLDAAAAENVQLRSKNSEIRQVLEGIRQIINPSNPPAIGELIPNEDIVHDYFLRIFGMLAANPKKIEE